MQTPFLNPNPFNWWYGIKNVARVRVSGERCMDLLDNGTQINTIMPGFVEYHSLDIRPLSYLVGRSVICTGLGKHLHLTYYPHHHMGSSRWSPGLWWGSISPHSPRFVQFHSLGPWDPGNPYDRPHCECDKREWDRLTCDTLGECPCSLPFGSLISDCHVGRWQGYY